MFFLLSPRLKRWSKMVEKWTFELADDLPFAAGSEV
jgi:hypothetical protein